MRRLVAWLRRRSPDGQVWARAVRAAVVVPVAFAVARALSTNAQLGTFAAFGSFALLLFLDPPRRTRARLLAYGVVIGVGAVSITLATCSMTVVTAVVGMAVVGFVVLMAASLGSYAAGATTAVLLTFVLPVSIPVPWSQLPWRLAGWGLAAAFAVPAGMLLRGSVAPGLLRVRAAECCRALGALLVAEARSDPVDRLAAEAAGAAERLRSEFSRTPYRPGGAGDTDRALAVLADQLEWVAGVAAEVAAADKRGHPCRGEIDTVVEVAGALRLVADSLDELCARDAHGQLPPDLVTAGAELRAVADGVDLWYRTLGDLLAGRRVTVPSADPPDSQRPDDVVGHLRSGLRAADPAATRHALLLLWSAQHLDSLRRVEPDLVNAAAEIAALRRRVAGRLVGAAR